MRLPSRGRLRTALTLAGCLLGDPTPGSLAAGGGIVAAGAALHLWSKGCLRQNRELTLSGPYRWVRNPFYLANLLIDLGLSVVIGRWWIALVYFPFWWAAYDRTMRREEAALETLFGERYRAYAARVPRLLPLRPPLPRPEGGPVFSWANPNLARGNEYARLVRMLMLPLLIYVVREIWNLGWSFPTGSHSLEWTLLWLVVALKGLDLALLRRLRDGRTLVPEPWRSLTARVLFACAFGLALLFVDVLETQLDLMALSSGAVGAGVVLTGLAYTPRTRPGLLLAWQTAACLVAGWMAELPWLGVLGACYFAALAIDALDVPGAPPPQAARPGWIKAWALACSLALLAVGPVKQRLEHRAAPEVVPRPAAAAGD